MQPTIRLIAVRINQIIGVIVVVCVAATRAQIGILVRQADLAAVAGADKAAGVAEALGLLVGVVGEVAVGNDRQAALVAGNAAAGDRGHQHFAQGQQVPQVQRDQAAQEAHLAEGSKALGQHLADIAAGSAHGQDVAGVHCLAVHDDAAPHTADEAAGGAGERQGGAAVGAVTVGGPVVVFHGKGAASGADVVGIEELGNPGGDLRRGFAREVGKPVEVQAALGRDVAIPFHKGVHVDHFEGPAVADRLLVGVSVPDVVSATQGTVDVAEFDGGVHDLQCAERIAQIQQTAQQAQAAGLRRAAALHQTAVAAGILMAEDAADADGRALTHGLRVRASAARHCHRAGAVVVEGGHLRGDKVPVVSSVHQELFRLLDKIVTAVILLHRLQLARVTRVDHIGGRTCARVHGSDEILPGQAGVIVSAAVGIDVAVNNVAVLVLIQINIDGISVAVHRAALLHDRDGSALAAPFGVAEAGDLAAHHVAHVTARHAALDGAHRAAVSAAVVRGALRPHRAAAGHAGGLAVADRGDEVLQQRGQRADVHHPVQDAAVAQGVRHGAGFHLAHIAARGNLAHDVLKQMDVAVLQMAAGELADIAAGIGDAQVVPVPELRRAAGPDPWAGDHVKAAGGAEDVGVLHRGDHHVQGAENAGELDRVAQQGQGVADGGGGAHVQQAGIAAGVVRAGNGVLVLQWSRAEVGRAEIGRTVHGLQIVRVDDHAGFQMIDVGVGDLHAATQAHITAGIAGLGGLGMVAVILGGEHRETIHPGVFLIRLADMRLLGAVDAGIHNHGYIGAEQTQQSVQVQSHAAEQIESAAAGLGQRTGMDIAAPAPGVHTAADIAEVKNGPGILRDAYRIGSPGGIIHMVAAAKADAGIGTSAYLCLACGGSACGERPVAIIALYLVVVSVHRVASRGGFRIHKAALEIAREAACAPGVHITLVDIVNGIAIEFRHQIGRHVQQVGKIKHTAVQHVGVVLRRAEQSADGGLAHEAAGNAALGPGRLDIFEIFNVAVRHNDAVGHRREAAGNIVLRLAARPLSGLLHGQTVAHADNVDPGEGGADALDQGQQIADGGDLQAQELNLEATGAGHVAGPGLAHKAAHIVVALDGHQVVADHVHHVAAHSQADSAARIVAQCFHGIAVLVVVRLGVVGGFHRVGLELGNAVCLRLAVKLRLAGGLLPRRAVVGVAVILQRDAADGGIGQLEADHAPHAQGVAQEARAAAGAELARDAAGEIPARVHVHQIGDGIAADKNVIGEGDGDMIAVFLVIVPILAQLLDVRQGGAGDPGALAVSQQAAGVAAGGAHVHRAQELAAHDGRGHHAGQIQQRVALGVVGAQQVVQQGGHGAQQVRAGLDVVAGAHHGAQRGLSGEAAHEVLGMAGILVLAEGLTDGADHQAAVLVRRAVEGIAVALHPHEAAQIRAALNRDIAVHDLTHHKLAVGMQRVDQVDAQAAEGGGDDGVPLHAGKAAAEHIRVDHQIIAVGKGALLQRRAHQGADEAADAELAVLVGEDDHIRHTVFHRGRGVARRDQHAHIQHVVQKQGDHVAQAQEVQQTAQVQDALQHLGQGVQQPGDAVVHGGAFDLADEAALADDVAALFVVDRPGARAGLIQGGDGVHREAGDLAVFHYALSVDLSGESAGGQTVGLGAPGVQQAVQVQHLGVEVAVDAFN